MNTFDLIQPKITQSNSKPPTTETLRDKLAAALGPKDDCETSYIQADKILSLLMDILREDKTSLQSAIEFAWDERAASAWPPKWAES